jgi:hypothetical protein
MTDANTPDDIDALRTITKALEPFRSEEQTRILRWVSEKLGLTTASTPPPQSPASQLSPTTPPTSPPTAGKATDIKSFVAAKKPKNDMQFAAVVAYFHRFEAPEKKETITSEDLLDACRLAIYPRPGAPSQTLRNAVNAGLLDKAERGAFSINTVGENLVAVTLPGNGGAAEPVRARKNRAKKAPAKKGAAKKK